MRDFDAVLQHINEEWKKRDIHCPKCKKKLDISERSSLVTYWGEDGWQKIDCEYCDHEFEVEENVTRTYEVREIGEEDG